TVLRPGGVPIEALEAVLPAVAFRPRHLSLNAEAAFSPGMLLKHYSPRAEMWLFGDAEEVSEQMLAAAGQALKEGRRVGALAYDDEAARWRELGAEVFELGSASEPEHAARLLFAGLRELDDRRVDVI